MLDEKELKIIEKQVPLLINDGEIVKDEKNKALTKFYTENSLTSLKTAKLLNEISFNINVKKHFNFLEDDFESCLWIINTSYYSMFYIASALLANNGIKIKSDMGIHKKTFETLVYYFYINRKMEKHFLEEFKVAQQECQELMRTEEPRLLMQKKAKELMDNYDSEIRKRSRFTYNMGEKVISTKAITSLQRALEFYNECLKMIK